MTKTPVWLIELNGGLGQGWLSNPTGYVALPCILQAGKTEFLLSKSPVKEDGKFEKEEIERKKGVVQALVVKACNLIREITGGGSQVQCQLG